MFLWYSMCIAKAALLLTSLVQRSVHEYIRLEYLSLAMGDKGIKVAIHWLHPPQMFTCDRPAHEGFLIPDLFVVLVYTDSSD